MNKDYIILYNRYREQFALLKDDRDFRRLIDALLDYNSTGTLPKRLNPVVNMAFSFIRADIDRDNAESEPECTEMPVVSTAIEPPKNIPLISNPIERIKQKQAEAKESLNAVMRVAAGEVKQPKRGTLGNS
jgi:hypothetical protein